MKGRLTVSRNSMTCQRNNCGGKLIPADFWCAPGMTATSCRICGAYHETRIEPIKPIPGKVLDSFGNHREPLPGRKEKPPEPTKNLPCIAPCCTGTYAVNLAKMPLCRKHNAMYYAWKAKAIFTPAPFIEVEGIWQVNQERIRWENETNNPRYRALTRLMLTSS